MSDASESLGLLAVPNVSEGRDAAIIERLEGAFALAADALDRHSDETHNRTVFTLAPHEGRAAEALVSGAREAIEAIDLSAHDGEHPRIGALDVAPVIYLGPGDREEARDQALEAAGAIAELGVPVFLYGELASVPERRERAYFRSGGLAALAARMERGELLPDMGPGAPHPTAGATLVTARPPLAAFNMEFEGMTLTQAKAVAAALRESGGGRPGVRAIALALDGRRHPDLDERARSRRDPACARWSPARASWPSRTPARSARRRSSGWCPGRRSTGSPATCPCLASTGLAA